jgi:bifunctional non-homologous end joining protein LigD
VREAPLRVESSRSRSAPLGAPREPAQKLSHPEKVLYPERGLTKLDLARHYQRVASRMLPHVDGRPLTLVRCPNGHHVDCWYQKHPTGALPDAIERAPIREKEGKSDYALVRSEEGLVALAQLGALEVHVWGSRAERLERPDRVVFDLDPSPEVGFGEVIEGAFLLRERLERLGLRSLPMITGGKGVHVVAPIAPEHDFGAVKSFTRGVAYALARELPARFLAKASKKARRGRTFIDYLRNGRGATAIAPYSTRARADAPVATPVAWEELPRVASASAFTLTDMDARLRGPDPWAGYFGIRQRLTASALRSMHAYGRER